MIQVRLLQFLGTIETFDLAPLVFYLFSPIYFDLFISQLSGKTISFILLGYYTKKSTHLDTVKSICNMWICVEAGKIVVNLKLHG